MAVHGAHIVWDRPGDFVAVEVVFIEADELIAAQRDVVASR